MTADMAEQEAAVAQIRESAAAVAALEVQAARIVEIASAIVSALRAGNKVLSAGNGGSAAEALHLSEELVGRFRGDRPSLPAVALVADTTALTCIGNDYGFDHIFSRQVEGLGRAGDVLVLFSTSGKARNLQLALKAGKARGVRTVCLLGRDGGALAGRADWELLAPGSSTERIQEVHQVVLHLILDVVERAFGAA